MNCCRSSLPNSLPMVHGTPRSNLEISGVPSATPTKSRPCGACWLSRILNRTKRPWLLATAAWSGSRPPKRARRLMHAQLRVVVERRWGTPSARRSSSSNCSSHSIPTAAGDGNRRTRVKPGRPGWRSMPSARPVAMPLAPPSSEPAVSGQDATGGRLLARGGKAHQGLGNGKLFRDGLGDRWHQQDYDRQLAEAEANGEEAFHDVQATTTDAPASPHGGAAGAARRRLSS